MAQQYNLFLVSEAVHYYPKSIITMLKGLGNSSVAITLDREYLSIKSPDTVFFERVNDDGSLLDNDTLIENVRRINPFFILLDNCFWDNSEVNSFLLDSLLNLQKEIQFLLVNLVTLPVFRNTQYEEVIQYKKARWLYYPYSNVNKAPWSIRFSSNTRFYENDDLDNDVLPLTIPVADPLVYKTAHRLFKGIKSLRLRHDLDFFTLFLDGLRIKYQDRHLLSLVLAVHKHFFDTGGYKPTKKETSLSSTEMNDLFERLNKPIICLIINNQTLFEEVISFFT